MGVPHQNVAAAVRKARDQAKTILDSLDTQGHPETARSSGLYLTLVMLQKRLLATDPPPPAVSTFVPDLEQLVSQCEGKLAPVKGLLQDAVRLARGSKA